MASCKSCVYFWQPSGLSNSRQGQCVQEEVGFGKQRRYKKRGWEEGCLRHRDVYLVQKLLPAAAEACGATLEAEFGGGRCLFCGAEDFLVAGGRFSCGGKARHAQLEDQLSVRGVGNRAEGTLLHLKVICTTGVLNVYPHKIMYLVEHGYLPAEHMNTTHPEIPSPSMVNGAGEAVGELEMGNAANV